MDHTEIGARISHVVLDDDAPNISYHAIGLLATYLARRADGLGGPDNLITLEDISGFDEDQTALQELIDEGALVLVDPDDEFSYVLLPEDAAQQG